MVVFVDLDDESEPPEEPGLRFNGHGFISRFGMSGERKVNHSVDIKEMMTAERKRIPIAEALGCYPIVISIASHIDLNTLDALSRTCHQVHVNLLQYRKHLLNSTLHCENEDMEMDPDQTIQYRARAADWYFEEITREAPGHSHTGKFGDCARDMVGGCRRCGRVACRNCTIKPPAPILLRHRYRRICVPCSRAPLESLSGLPAQTPPLAPNPKIQAEILKRSVCNCATEGVWLCRPCGRSLRNQDLEYEDIWKWYTRYLPSLGGLGVGIGEGNRGVPCGRGGDCVAAHEVEQETDCDAEDAREIETRAGSPSSSPPGSFLNGSGQLGPGYARHEIEGIGGVVKKKLVKMVKVGACVPEWSDEKKASEFLTGEFVGKYRSWCGWCWRVIPGANDVIELNNV